MAAAFRHVSMLHHVDTVGNRHIGQAVGNQDDGLLPRQPMNLPHDVVLTLHIDIGGGFIENIDRAVVEQGPGQRQSLALAAGKVGGLLRQGRVQSVLAFQEVRQLYPLQHGPQLAVGSAWPGRGQVFPHGAFEQVALVADVGQVLHQAFLGKLRQLLAADFHPAAIAPAPSHEDCCHRGFPAAALAHDGGKAAFGEFHLDAVEDFPALFIRKTQPLAHNGAVLRNRNRLRRRLRQIQQPENFVAGGHAVHGDVEKASQLPHGDEEVRRQQNNQKASRQGHFPSPKLGHRHDDSQRRAAVGNQVHDGDGVQLHGQHFHGDFAEFLRFLVHFLILEAVRLVDFQGGQALEVLQKGIPQRRVLAPVSGQQFLRPGLDCRYGHGNQRDADQQHHGGGDVHKAEVPEQGQGRQHGVKELGQIRAEVGLQLIHALHRHLDNLRGLHLFPVGSPQLQQLPVDFLPEGLLHRLGGQIAHGAGACGADVADNDGKGRQDGRRQDIAAASCTPEQSGQQPSDGCHHDDIGGKGTPLQRHVPGYVFLAFADCAYQPFINHHGALSSLANIY